MRQGGPTFATGVADTNFAVVGKECVLRIHLVPALGDKALAAITTEDVQNLKGALSTKSPKTVNNVLTVLKVPMRTVVL